MASRPWRQEEFRQELRPTKEMRTPAPRSALLRDFLPAARTTAQKSNRKPRLQEHCVNSALEREPVRVYLPARRPEPRGFPLPFARRENVSVRAASRLELRAPCI